LTGQAPGLLLEFEIIADHPINLWHLCISLRMNLCAAAGDNDFSLWISAAGPPYRLPCLPFCFTCNSASIENYYIFETRLFGVRLHHLGFIGIQAATEGNDLRFFG